MIPPASLLRLKYTELKLPQALGIADHLERRNLVLGKCKTQHTE